SHKPRTCGFARARLGWQFFCPGGIILPRCCPPLQAVVPSAVAGHGCPPAIGTVEVLLVTTSSRARLPFFLLLTVMSFGLLGNVDADTAAPWASRETAPPPRSVYVGPGLSAEN